MNAQAKIYLKNAKDALQKKDYELSIEWCQDVLEEDKSNYFAHLFLGKNYAILDKTTLSLENYLKALEIDNQNLLAWKGLFQLFEQGKYDKSVVTYDQFFRLCAKYYQLLVAAQEPCVRLINTIRDFKKERETDCERDFLENMRPGKPFAESLGRHFMEPRQVLQKILNITLKEENSKVSTVRAKKAMNLSPSDPMYTIQLNELAWEIYSKSEVSDLYKQLINLVDDDEERTSLEEDLFQYKLKVLKSMPLNLKRENAIELKEMVDDMIIVGHDSNEIWNYYFDWSDFESLDDLDLNLVTQFIKKFPDDPLANILYAYICSSVSVYDKVKFFKQTWGEVTSAKHTEETSGLQEDEDAVLLLNSEDDCMAAMADAIEHAQTSILAHRIFSNYTIAFQNYAAALKYVLHGISVTMKLARELDIEMDNTNNDMTLNLALIYTHVDSPKNHQTALQLYNKYLAHHPESHRAKLGKALIFIEQKNWQDADVLLEDVIKVNYDPVALSHYSWVKMHLGELDESITTFKKSLSLLSGMDIPSLRVRSTNLWRLAKCYVKKYEQSDNSEYLNFAFKYLIDSIKCTEDFHEGFSTLGDLYANCYNDPVRAFKCYHKSFSIYPGDIKAAEYMVTRFTSDNEWAAAALICTTLIQSQLVKRELQTLNWPYRVLGISYLEIQKPEDSIQWFQAALRVNPADVEALVGLGQAYLQCGKVEAALKVFTKAKEIAPEHVYSMYFYAMTLSELGKFGECLPVFENLIQNHSDNECFRIGYVTVLMTYAETIEQQGFLSKSVDVASEIIEEIKHIVCDLKSQNQGLWIVLCRALKLFLSVRSKLDILPVEALIDIFQEVDFKQVPLHGGIVVDSLFEETDSLKIVAKCLILTCKCSFAVVKFNELPRALKSSLYFNLGTVELYSYTILNDSSFRDMAIESFKKCISYQSNMVEAWVGLGISCMDVNYKVSQHCFIRALSLSPKDVNIWYNIALLALKNNDYQFALEIFTKSQSVAPENASVRLGMALALEMSGETATSQKMFKHSYILSNGSSTVAELFYAKTVLHERLQQGLSDERNVEGQQEFVAILHGLESYLKKLPDDVFAIQCCIIVLERIRNYKKAQFYVQRLVSIVEANFAETNDEKELIHYGFIKSQFARVQLGMEMYDEALDTAQLSLSVLEDHKENELYKNAIISNYCVISLCYYFQKRFDESMECFSNVLEENSDDMNEDLIVLVCKVLYNIGGDDFENMTMSEQIHFLGESMTIGRSVFLACIAILKSTDQKELQTALDVISKFAIDSSDTYKDIPYLMEQISKKLGINSIEKNQNIQRNALFFPQNTSVWKLINDKITYKVGLNNYKQLSVVEKSNELIRLKNLRKIQRGVFLCPWNPQAVSSLKECF